MAAKNLNNVPQHLLECPICLQILVAPITLSCGHSFCEQCIKSFFYSFTNKACPLCRKSISRNLNSFSVNVLLDQLVKLQYLQTKEYRLRVQKAKIFLKDCSESRIVKILRWIGNIFPWAVLLILVYHLLKMKIRFSKSNFKSFKDKAIKLLELLKFQNNLDYKFLLFSQLMRIISSSFPNF